jgi:hypothetical protein
VDLSIRAGSLLGLFDTLKNKAICLSETSVDFQRATLRYIPEHRTHNCLCETRNYKVFELRASSGILEPRKYSVSETGSVSVLR